MNQNKLNKKTKLNVNEIADEMFKDKDKHLEKHVIYRSPEIPEIMKKWNCTPQKARMVQRKVETLRLFGDGNTWKPEKERLSDSQLSIIAMQILGENNKKKFFKLIPHKENIMKHYGIDKDMFGLVCKEIERKLAEQRKWKLKAELREASKHLEDEWNGIEY